MSPSDPTTPPHGRDRHDIVTPYAFQVHPKLLGLPLASPWRRAVAIALDGVAIGVLSNVPGGFLVLAASGVMLRWAAGWRGKRRGLRWSGALIGVLVLWGLYGAASNLFGIAGKLHLGGASALAKLAIDVEEKRCQNADCARGPLQRFAAFAGARGMSDATAEDAIHDVLAGLPVDDKARDELRTAYLKQVAASRKLDAGDARDDDPPGVGAPDAAAGPRKPVTSAIAWMRGLLDDLGIGLGWAALYFTAFCTYWNGQTPGKRLLGIRVVQLDGSPMTFWESFERAGGYGAGFATGLLGFAQVFWDANRQAIQDKICETVVIRGDLPADAHAS
jgi:hypothetical protein